MVLEDRPDIVVCAGWMLIVTPSFLDKLAAAKVPIINLHPALPGGMYARSPYQNCDATF